MKLLRSFIFISILIIFSSLTLYAQEIHIPLGTYITNSAYYGSTGENVCSLRIDNEKIIIDVLKNNPPIRYSIHKKTKHSIIIEISGDIKECFNPDHNYWRIDYAAFKYCRDKTKECPIEFKNEGVVNNSKKRFEVSTYKSFLEAEDYNRTGDLHRYYNAYEWLENIKIPNNLINTDGK